MLYVSAPPRQKVIETDEFTSIVQQSFAQMRAEKTDSTHYQNPSRGSCRHDISIRSSNVVMTARKPVSGRARTGSGTRVLGTAYLGRADRLVLLGVARRRPNG